MAQKIVGEVEYDSGVAANTPATRAMIDRYVDHFNEEKERQTQEKLKKKKKRGSSHCLGKRQWQN